jgi:hypothetical protein
MVDRSVTLERRLANLRGSGTWPVAPSDPPVRVTRSDLAARLASALDGAVVRTPFGAYVRCDRPARHLPIDRDRLARLPGQPPAHVPLVCLDTETTGLATAAGTVAFLVGLGWWAGPTFHQAQILLPDHADEPALLTAVAELIPADAWLVTYNGRGFDWPLLVARYRMARWSAPPLAGHLDLLPIVRRLFRHRMTDARLRTVETTLLGLRRVGDIDGWEIPGRYLHFLRGGPADPLIDVVRHNDQDVLSLAGLLGHLERDYGDPVTRLSAPRGDLAGLARAFARERRLTDALDCLEAATERPLDRTPVRDMAHPADDWWSPRRRPDFGGAPHRRAGVADQSRPAAFDAPWTDERIAIDRAHVLRRLGRHLDAADAWSVLAASPGRISVLAWTEIAKVREHRLRDLTGALDATNRGMAAAERRRRLGRPEPALEADLARRRARLLTRMARRRRAA